MIGFALRLTLAGGREAAVRLVIIAVAVALGVGLLLTTLAGINAVNTQNARYAWLNSGVAAVADARPPAAADPLWWRLTGDYFDRLTIGRVDVAATGPAAPVPPGIPRLPGPGEFYASPALGSLLRTVPGAQLGDRFPGHQVGTIGAAALPAPDSLIIIIGHTPDELARWSGAHRVTRVQTTAPSGCDGCEVGIRAAGLDLILSVVALSLLFPVLMFVGTAARLAATRREQRFAAMRLVGATPRQVSLISTVESTISALAGTIIGFGLFFVFRGPLAAIPVTGAPFFPADLSLNPADVLLVAIGVPAAAAAAAWAALRRVRISPLGVSRRVTPRAPRAYRLVPLVAGIAELAYWVGRRPGTTAGQIQAFLPGFFVIMVGLVIAGPWLTMAGSRVIAGRTRRAAGLVAARRLADNPRVAFRAISGLVLALFVTSVAVGTIGTISANEGTPAGGPGTDLLTANFRPDLSPPAAAPPALKSLPGVHGAVVVRVPPDGMKPPGVDTDRGPRPYALASCADIAAAPDFGRCAAGAQTAWVYSDLIGPRTPVGTSRVWPAASISPERLRRLPAMSIVVGTDGSRPAVERARTVVEAAFPQRYPPATQAEWNSDSARTLNQWKQLANVVIVASLVIAGCSLTVTVAGGLADRKRPFSVLRLTGVPLGVLRRVVALETAAPLLAAAVVAIGAGFLAAHLFLTAQMRYGLRPPGLAFYVLVLTGLAAALGIIASTLPLLGRVTGPQAARNE
ncbi:MAG TPA: FtsX-like permease family protein [Streptosporangiaceae bacterium]